MATDDAWEGSSFNMVLVRLAQIQVTYCSSAICTSLLIAGVLRSGFRQRVGHDASHSASLPAACSHKADHDSESLSVSLRSWKAALYLVVQR